MKNRAICGGRSRWKSGGRNLRGKSWSFYRRVAILSAVGIAGVTAVVAGVRFVLYAPQFALLKPDQIELTRKQNCVARCGAEAVFTGP